MSSKQIASTKNKGRSLERERGSPPRERRGEQKHGSPKEQERKDREEECREDDHLFNEWEPIQMNI